MKQKLAIFISGRGSNMQAILDACATGILKDLAEVVLVFSNNPKAKGLETARMAGIPAKALDSKGRRRENFDQDVLEVLQPYRPNYLILAGYMQILSSVLIEAYAGHIINIHPADTRQHQGLGAYEWAVTNKLDTTHITVHYVDEGVDTGRIIAQYPVDLSGANTLDAVKQRGLAVEHAHYKEAIKTVLERDLKRRQS
jgi:phosphoribosylglycinamide formyltransferase-1